MRKIYSTFLLLFLMVAVTGLYGQTASEAQGIANRSNVNALKKISEERTKINHAEKFKAQQMAKQKGWMIKGFTDDGRFVELMRVENDLPIYYETRNVNAAKSTRTNFLHTGGGLGLDLNGENMTAYVWDGGHALTTHVEYDGPGGTDRVTLGDSPYTTNYHSGHVMGTILAYGYTASAKGMAPKAKGKAYEWTNDDAEASTAAGAGMLLSNHSYGFASDKVPDYYFGAYITDSRTWDQIMYNAPYYLMVNAAGNDGATNYNASPLDGQTAYDKLTGHSTSKNALVVGNANDATVDVNGVVTSVTRNSSSSEGPTDDYRIKPDVMGNGTSVYSSGVTSTTNYLSLTGTSMASPNVTGSLLLLQQHYKNLKGTFMKAATLKGLAIHTADDMETTGPDANTGFGLLNAKKAAQVISGIDNGTIVRELTLAQGQSYTTTVTASGLEKLLASISWTDPAGTATTLLNSKTPVLVNDLDIRVTKSSTVYYPWKLTGVTTTAKGDNLVDPFELVEVIGATGDYTITVTHKGTLSASQAFTLIVTGITTGTPTVDTQAPTVPTGLTYSNLAATSVALSWTASTDNVGVTGYDIYSGTTLIGSTASTTANITGLTPSTTYSFSVKAKDAAGNISASSNVVTFTTPAQEEVPVPTTYCTLNGTNVRYEWIDYVALNGMANTTGANGGYADFTSKVAPLPFGSNTITLSAGFSGTIYTEYWYVWIDYNKDGTFGSDELVISGSVKTSGNATGTFTVPTTAKTGYTRMRVAMKYSASTASCGTFTYGEVEDYTVNVGSSTTTSLKSFDDGVVLNGIDDTPQLVVYPNPATSGMVTVLSNEIPEGQFEVIDLSGKLIKLDMFSNSTIRLDVTGFKKGSYFIRVAKDGRTSTVKLIVQ